MSKRTVSIFLGLLVLVSFVTIGCNESIPYKQINSKTTNLSEVVDKAVQQWAESVKDNKGIFIAKKQQSDNTTTYYLLVSKYKIKNESVNFDKKLKNINITIYEDNDSDEVTFLKQENIQNDITEIININGKEINVSEIQQLN
jgi:hypothetical protein